MRLEGWMGAVLGGCRSAAREGCFILHWSWVGADLLDAGGGAENHGNAARAGIGSFWGSGSDAQVTATNQETGVSVRITATRRERIRFRV